MLDHFGSLWGKVLGEYPWSRLAIHGKFTTWKSGRDADAQSFPPNLRNMLCDRHCFKVKITITTIHSIINCKVSSMSSKRPIAARPFCNYFPSPSFSFWVGCGAVTIQNYFGASIIPSFWPSWDLPLTTRW